MCLAIMLASSTKVLSMSCVTWPLAFGVFDGRQSHRTFKISKKGACFFVSLEDVLIKCKPLNFVAFVLSIIL